MNLELFQIKENNSERGQKRNGKIYGVTETKRKRYCFKKYPTKINPGESLCKMQLKEVLLKKVRWRLLVPTERMIDVWTDWIILEQ